MLLVNIEDAVIGRLPGTWLVHHMPHSTETHEIGDMVIEWRHGKYLADHIPKARFVLIPTQDHLPWVGKPQLILDEIEEFLTGLKSSSPIDRILSTLMFTDIVDSTRLASEMGDEKWSALLAAHHIELQRQVSVYRGEVIETTGDGVFVAFDGPARALSCAQVINHSMTSMGLSVRIGIHTGECLIRNGVYSGIAVHIAARIAAKASSGQILASRTVKDLVAGSSVSLHDFGVHQLKGVEDEWQLFEVV